MENAQKLAGKIALITGGTTGIGLATAKRFVAEGAYVFITGRRAAELAAAEQELGATAAHGIQGDVASLADLDRIVAIIKAQKGHLDIVFANAGVADFAPLADAPEAHFDKHFDINVKGTFFTVQKALPLLRDGGAIILTSSMVGSQGPANLSVYSATKAAIRSFARTWTAELKDRRIRVNAVSPGSIITPGLSAFGQTPEQTAQLFEALASQVPLGRLGDADEVGKAVVFLASDDSSYITGVELFVDGGVAQV
ncbi:SDR family oxidoreductase [Hymenobacter daeguensis]